MILSHTLPIFYTLKSELLNFYHTLPDFQDSPLFNKSSVSKCADWVHPFTGHQYLLHILLNYETNIKSFTKKNNVNNSTANALKIWGFFNFNFLDKERKHEKTSDGMQYALKDYRRDKFPQII